MKNLQVVETCKGAVFEVNPDLVGAWDVHFAAQELSQVHDCHGCWTLQVPLVSHLQIIQIFHTNTHYKGNVPNYITERHNIMKALSILKQTKHYFKPNNVNV